jgi:NAD(P)-dependent dehydrogenase (short-subunit alcohol dehydrogenase family)
VVANATRPSTVRLLKTVSDEYVRYGITINTVAPGWIETHNAIEYIDKNIGLRTEQQRRDYMLNTAGVPAARMGKPRRDRVPSRVLVLGTSWLPHRQLDRSRWRPAQVRVLARSGTPDQLTCAIVEYFSTSSCL